MPNWQEVGNDRKGGSKYDSAPIKKWGIGETIEGVYVETRKGKLGPLAEFKKDDGTKVVYGIPTVLQRKLGLVNPGERVHIVCIGKKPGNNGTSFWDFEVKVDRVQVNAPQIQIIGKPGSEVRTSEVVGADGFRLPDRPMELVRLHGIIQAEKGQLIADVMLQAARAAGDPVNALRSAMKQIGFNPDEDVPF